MINKLLSFKYFINNYLEPFFGLRTFRYKEKKKNIIEKYA